MHPEIDWNAEYMRFLPLVIEAKSDLEYYLLLMRFYALLRDGHTSVIPPPALFEGKSVPFAVICAEGKFLLSAVDKDQSELLLSEITHIQGQPINEYIKNVYPFYWHELPESLFACNDCIEASLMFNFGADERISIVTDKGELNFKMSRAAETVWADTEVKYPEPLDKCFQSESLIISLTKDNIAIADRSRRNTYESLHCLRCGKFCILFQNQRQSNNCRYNNLRLGLGGYDKRPAPWRKDVACYNMQQADRRQRLC